MATDKTDWLLRGISRDTQRKIKGYAGANGLTIPEALKRIVEKWEAANGK